jgi:hypothetical protein
VIGAGRRDLGQEGQHRSHRLDPRRRHPLPQPDIDRLHAAHHGTADLQVFRSWLVRAPVWVPETLRSRRARPVSASAPASGHLTRLAGAGRQTQVL